METQPSLFKYKTVMLIEDEVIDNFINERITTKLFFSKDVLIHTNVESALEYFKNVEEHSLDLPLPDFIFLDLNLPLLDGWHFLQEFEKLNFPFDCKIVLLTASINPADKERSKTHKNVVGFFSKPLTEEILIAISSMRIPCFFNKI